MSSSESGKSLKDEFYLQIHQKHSFFERIKQQALDGICYWHVEQPEQIWISPTFFRSLGYAATEYQGGTDKWFGLIHPDDLLKLEQAIEDVANRNYPASSCIVRFFNADGDVRWRALRLITFRDEHDAITEIVAVHIDIHQVKSHEILLERILLAANEGWWDWDVVRDYFMVSEQWWNDIGYAPNEFEIQHGKWQHLIHPDDKDNIKSLTVGLLKHEEQFRVEFRLQHKNGHYVPFLSRGYVLRDGDGKVVHIIGTNADMTVTYLQRRDIEKLTRDYEMIFNGSQDSIFLVEITPEGEFRYVRTNTAHQKSSGFALEFIQGKTPIELIGEEIGLHIQQNYQRCVDARDTITYDEYLDLPGGIKWWRTSLSPVIEHDRVIYIVGSSTEITEQKNAEESLLNISLLLNEAQSLAALGGWELDVATGITTWTEEVYRIHEVESDYQSTAEKGIEFYHPDDRPTIIEAVTKCMQYGEPFDVECRFVTAKNRQLWVRATGKAIRKNDTVVKVIGAFQDISKRKEYEQTLQEITLRLSLAASSAKMGIWDYDIPSGKLTWDDRMYELYGLTNLETPLTYETWKNAIYTEDSDIAIAMVNQTATYGNELETEFRIMRPDGQILYLHAQGKAILDSAGVPIRIVGVNFDITERKKAEVALERKQQILSSIALATDELLKTSDYISATARALPLLATSTGVECVAMLRFLNAKDEILIKKELYWSSNNKEFLLQDQFSGILKLHTPSLYQGECVLLEADSLQVQGITTYLQERQIQSLLILPILVRGELWGVLPILATFSKEMWSKEEIAILLSFTGSLSSAIQRTLLEKELEISVEKAESASKAKSEFLANMSHEIRTPLNAVIGFTDLLIRTQLSPTQSEYMANVYQSANSLLDLLNDILDFSKIEAGKLELSPERTDIIELIEQATDVIKYKAHEKHIEVLVDIPFDMPRFIWVDPIRLRQVLVNLLGNAVKFTHKGEIELSVLYTPIKDNYGECLFSVRDTGVGIPPEHQQRIFEAFTQEDSSTTRKYGGTGLGLTISNKILKLMNSKLELESNAGGSRFFFIVETSAEPEPFLPITPELVPLKKVLVVDDNTNNRLILEKMFLFAGIQVVTASNGINGLEILTHDRSIDALILDYHMPFMDGLEVLRNIREELRLSAETLPILFLHSSSDNEYIYEQCQKYQVGVKLTKPVRMQQLFESLQHLKQQPVPLKNIVVNKETEPTAKVLHSKVARKILIVEDNPTNSLLAKTIIKNVDPECVIIQAWNGSEGVELLQQEHPHLVFMDIHMPVMNGYAATHAIREYEKQEKLLPTPIIALTAATVEGEQQRCLEAGMNGYITKPIVAQSIREMMEHFLPY